MLFYYKIDIVRFL